MAKANKSGPAVIGTGRDHQAAGIPSKPTSPAIGNPYAAADYSARRLSEPLTSGRAATSNQDHGVGAGRNPGLAEGIEGRSINQQALKPEVWQSLSSRNGDNQYGDRDITHSTGRVNLQHLDLATAANGVSFRDPVSGSPVTRPMDRSARNSPTSPNPSMPRQGDQQGSCSRSPLSAKQHKDTNTSLLDMMKTHVRNQLGD